MVKKRLNKLQYFRRHFQRMHPNEPLLEVAEYKCEECGSVFQQRSHLTAHVKLQHCPKSTMYQCSSCASQFTNKVCTLCLMFCYYIIIHRSRTVHSAYCKAQAKDRLGKVAEKIFKGH